MCLFNYESFLFDSPVPTVRIFCFVPPRVKNSVNIVKCKQCKVRAASSSRGANPEKSLRRAASFDTSLFLVQFISINVNHRWSFFRLALVCHNNL